MTRLRHVGVGVLTVGVLVSCTNGHAVSGSTPGSTPGPSSGGSPGGGPTHRLVYRVTDTSSPSVNVTTVVQEVEPPYRARTLTFQGEGTSMPLGGSAWADGALYTINADGMVAQSAVVTPGEAGPDSRLAVSLPVAEAQHLLRRTGRATVLRVDCTQWESKEPLDSGTFAAASGGNHATSCVDAQGRILQDQWYLSGVLVRTRVAVELTDAPALDDARLFGGQTPIPPPAGAVTEEVKPLTGPADHDFGVRAAHPPAGFGFDGAVALRDNVAGETTPVPVRVGQVSAYRRGEDLVVIKRLVSLVGPQSLPTRGAVLDLGGLGKATLEATFGGLVVTFVSTTGVLVSVTGSVGEAELLAWVGTLTVVAVPL